MSAIQFGDVIRALEICLWIKRHCFEPINSASLLWLEFRNDIIDLETRLIQFQSSFESIALSVASSVDHAALLKGEADRLVGDFVATLKECKRVVEKHAEFDRGRATVLDNAFWHTNTQPIVADLRQRLQGHQHKLILFLDFFRLDILTDVRADTTEILEILRRQAGPNVPLQLPEIPPLVCTAFEDALQRDAPETIPTSWQIPLQEGVDALSKHYRECTFQSDSLGIGPGLQSHLSLLKAHWLYITIQNSQALRSSRSGSLFRRVVEQLGRGIEEQYQKHAITEWSDDTFWDLDVAEFAIWPVKIVPKAPLLTDAKGREEKLFEAALACYYAGERQDLFIFRAEDKLLRMVESRSRLDGSVGAQMTERWIHLDEDRFIPVYAIAARDGSPGTVNMSHGNGAQLDNYEFTSRRSVLKVQEAFTGYEVIASSLNVLCSLTYKSRWSPRDNQEIGQGEVQMWMKPGSLDLSSMPTSPAATVGSSERSVTTGSSYTLASQTFSGFDKRIMSIKERDDGGELVVSQLPSAPLLVFLVKGQKNYSIWQTDLSCLDPGQPRRIKTKDGRQLYRLTLQVPTGKEFLVNRLSVTEAQLGLWDLHAMQKAPNLKAKSKDKSLPKVEKLEATALDLDFATEQAHNRFELFFKHVFNAREDQVNQYTAGSKVAISQAHKPSQKSNHPAVLPRRDSGPTVSQATIRAIDPEITDRHSQRFSHATTSSIHGFGSREMNNTGRGIAEVVGDQAPRMSSHAATSQRTDDGSRDSYTPSTFAAPSFTDLSSRRTSHITTSQRIDYSPRDSYMPPGDSAPRRSDRPSQRSSNSITSQRTDSGARGLYAPLRGTASEFTDMPSPRLTYATSNSFERGDYVPRGAATATRDIPPGISGVYPDLPPSLEPLKPLPAIDLGGISSDHASRRNFG